MKIKVMLFAQLRDATGKPNIEVELNGEVTLMELLRKVVDEYPQLRNLVFEKDGWTLKKSYQVLVSGETVADLNRTLRGGDVVAILPPVAGG